MGQVNNSDTNAKFWADLGLPLPANGGTESTAIANLHSIGTEFSIDGLSKAEATVLKSITTLSISDPQLPAADKEKLINFLNTLDQAIAKTQPSTYEKKVVNDWLSLSAVVDLFKSTSEIALLLSKMAREDSKLKQAIGGLLLEMAKDAKNLAIAAGEARAQQYEADARKAWVEFGCALGQMVTISITAVVTKIREKQYEDPAREMLQAGNKTPSEAAVSLKAHEMALQDMNPFQQFSTALTTAVKSGIEATIDTEKAALERVASQSEGIKQLIDKIFQMLQETYSTLTDDMKELRASLDKLIQTLENAQRTSSEQWKA